jgi:hypothetical protein
MFSARAPLPQRPQTTNEADTKSIVAELLDALAKQ